MHVWKHNPLLAKWIGYVYNCLSKRAFLFQDCAILLATEIICG